MAVVTQTTYTTTEKSVVPVDHRRPVAARVSQFIDYLFWLLYTLLIVRLLLVFFHASTATGFVQFIDRVTNPFYAPFSGITASPTVEGGFTLAIPILVALVVYGLLHLAINKLLRVFAYRRTTV